MCVLVLIFKHSCLLDGNRIMCFGSKYTGRCRGSVCPCVCVRFRVEGGSMCCDDCPPPHPPLCSLTRRGAACLLVCVLDVCASWRASCVWWRSAARGRCSAAPPARSCRATTPSGPRAFASSGPTRLWAGVPPQVRGNQDSLASFLRVFRGFVFKNLSV